MLYTSTTTDTSGVERQKTGLRTGKGTAERKPAA